MSWWWAMPEASMQKVSIVDRLTIRTHNKCTALLRITWLSPAYDNWIIQVGSVINIYVRVRSVCVSVCRLVGQCVCVCIIWMIWSKTMRQRFIEWFWLFDLLVWWKWITHPADSTNNEHKRSVRSMSVVTMLKRQHLTRDSFVHNEYWSLPIL